MIDYKKLTEVFLSFLSYTIHYTLFTILLLLFINRILSYLKLLFYVIALMIETDAGMVTMMKMIMIMIMIIIRRMKMLISTALIQHPLVVVVAVKGISMKCV